MGNIHVLQLAILLLFLVFCSSPSSVFGFAEIYAHKTHVYVTNDLAPGTPMTLHCKSKNDDLGPKVLQYNEYYTWEFTVNFWQTTLFWCYMNYYDTKLVETTKTLYKAKRDYPKSGFDVDWFVRKDGIYRKSSDGHYEFTFPWQ